MFCDKGIGRKLVMDLPAADIGDSHGVLKSKASIW